MKQLCSLFAAALCIFLFTYASAADEYTMTDDFHDELDTFTRSLPGTLQEDVAGYLQSGDVDGLLNESLSVSSGVEKIGAQLKSAWPTALAVFFKLFAVLILTAIARRMHSAFARDGAGMPMEICFSLCIVLAVTPWVENISASGESYLSALTTLMDGVTPIATSLFVASGNLTAAATVNASMMLVYTVIQNVLQVFYLPIIRLLFVLSIVSYVGIGIRTDGIGRFVRRLFTWLLSILTLILSLLIGIQHSVALNVDSFSVRTVKFALGSFIPLVGNAISDAIGTVAGSLNMIKSACGAVGVIATLILLLPPLIYTLLIRAALSAAQGVAELMGCEKEGRLLSEIHGIFGYMMAVMALSSVLFVFILSLMIGIRL
jgi:stage III sporulation protein AE